MHVPSQQPFQLEHGPPRLEQHESPSQRPLQHEEAVACVQYEPEGTHDPPLPPVAVAPPPVLVVPALPPEGSAPPDAVLPPGEAPPVPPDGFRAPPVAVAPPMEEAPDAAPPGLASRAPTRESSAVPPPPQPNAMASTAAAPEMSFEDIP
jgi:hypothetical protein